jgi:cytochrome P450
MDPPEHSRLRKLVAAVFTRRRLEKFSTQISNRAAVLLGRVAGDGACDLADLTNDFPVANLAELLGAPAEDTRLLLDWTNLVIGYQDPEQGPPVLDARGQPVNPRSPAALRDMFDYARDLGDYKRAHPADDLMTALVTSSIDGRRLTDAELDMFFFLLVIAGNDTVRSALPGGVLALIEHPDEYRKLRADPTLLGTAIEEMLRWHPPVLTFRRTAAADVELAGQRVQHGDKVVVYHISANYDERQFHAPFRFDVSRRPNDHLAFGQGPHMCLGAQFARLQMRLFFSQLVQRLPPLELDGLPVRLTSNFINGITHLPVRMMA